MNGKATDSEPLTHPKKEPYAKWLQTDNLLPVV